jgi:hypothetical protein
MTVQRIALPGDVVERLQLFGERIGMPWKEVASLWLAMMVREKTPEP